MTKFRIIAVLGFLLGGLLFFQNCSGGMQSLSPNTSSSREPTDSGFKSGDDFDYSQLSNRSQMLTVFLEKSNYAASTKIRAVALAKNGLGFVKIIDAGTQDQADTMALEGCFVLSGGSPCLILARADKFALDQKNLAASYNFQLTTPTALTAANLPFVHPMNRANVDSLYQAAIAPKALAIAVDGTYVIAANTSAYPVSSNAEAQRLALERCELSTLTAPCTLIAVNSSLFFDPLQINPTPSIRYSDSVIGASIPGMRDADFTAYISGYLTALNQPGYKGSLFITGVGAWGASYSAAAGFDVRTKAQTDCVNSGVDQNLYPCIQFANDKNIVATAATLLSAIRNQPLDLHCKVIPRFNCAAHVSMGCPSAGDYYTTRSGRVQIESCL